MKDECIALVLLVCLLSLFVYNAQVMKGHSKEVIKLIDRVDGKDFAVMEDVEKIKTKWNKNKKILMYFTSHENILNVDECVEMAEECMDAQRPDMAKYFLKKARHYLKDMQNKEKISLDNIF